MKKSSLIIVFVLSSFSGYSQNNYTVNQLRVADIVTLSSLCDLQPAYCDDVRIDLHYGYDGDSLIYVNDTLLVDWINAKSGGGGSSEGAINNVNVSDGLGGFDSSDYYMVKALGNTYLEYDESQMTIRKYGSNDLYLQFGTLGGSIRTTSSLTELRDFDNVFSDTVTTTIIDGDGDIVMINGLDIASNGGSLSSPTATFNLIASGSGNITINDDLRITENDDFYPITSGTSNIGRSTNIFGIGFIDSLVLENFSLGGPDGTNGQVLTTDGAGNVSFQDAGGGGGSTGAQYNINVSDGAGSFEASGLTLNSNSIQNASGSVILEGWTYSSSSASTNASLMAISNTAGEITLNGNDTGNDVIVEGIGFNNTTISSNGGGGLIIDDNNTSTITLNGGDIDLEASTSLTINNAYTIPLSDGSSGQVYTTDGAGTVSFQTILTPTSTEYSPTTNDPVNCSSVTQIAPLRYTTIGDVVEVSGGYTVTITSSGTQATFDIPLPSTATTSIETGMGVAWENTTDNSTPLVVTAVGTTEMRVRIFANTVVSGSSQVILTFNYRYEE